MYYILILLTAFGGWTKLDYDGSGRKTERDTATITAGASDSTYWLDLSYSTDHSVMILADTLTSDTLNFIVYYRTAPVKPSLDTLLENRENDIQWEAVDTIIGASSYYPADVVYPLFLKTASVIQFKVKAIVGLKVFLYFREE